mmetsp:Transcript_48282/g.121918  ORF Transcript_48282/g.121918 Transcript_48282/m.121918 type:complete len:255 (+) Transcript_48282:1059-1823(+)
MRDVGAGGLAKCGDGVDGGNALREHGVGRQLGQLRGPEVGGQDALRWDPLLVHTAQHFERLLPARGVLATDEHPVWAHEVVYGSAFRKELRVGENLKLDLAVRAVALQHLADGLRGADRHGGLLHDDLVARGDARDHAGGALPVRQVRRAAGAHTPCLRGCVHAHEDDVCLRDMLLGVRAEKKVAPPGLEHHIVQAGLVDGQVVAVPRGHALRIDVQDDHLYGGALVRDDGHGGPADIAGANACDLHVAAPRCQ